MGASNTAELLCHGYIVTAQSVLVGRSMNECVVLVRASNLSVPSQSFYFINI